MQLELFSDDGKFIKSLNDDSTTLLSYNVVDKMRIHVSTSLRCMCYECDQGLIAIKAILSGLST